MTNETYFGIRKALSEAIKDTMWEGHVFLVGGCIRDELMHREIHDIDIAVDLPNGGIRFARWLQKRHIAARGRSVQVFIHFGTAKVQLRMFPKEVIDCVQTRKDKYVYEKIPKPEENFGTILEDATRRDLSINSLYVNVSTGELLDPTETGLKDIENHIIRTPNDPDVTFTDNPMHILRCIRFAAKYGWDIAPDILDGMKRNVGILAEARQKRLMKETCSILTLEHKEKALQLINEIGAMPYIETTLQLVQSMLDAGIKPDQIIDPLPNNTERKQHHSKHRHPKRHREKRQDKDPKSQ